MQITCQWYETLKWTKRGWILPSAGAGTGAFRLRDADLEEDAAAAADVAAAAAAAADDAAAAAEDEATAEDEAAAAGAAKDSCPA